MNRQAFRRGVLSQATALLIAAVAVAACGEGSSSSTTSHTPETLKILNLEGGTDYFKNLADGFHAKYPWITVQYEVVPGPNFQTKWDTYIAACGSSKNCPSGPDIIEIQSGGIFLPYKQALQTLPELKPFLSQYAGTANFCDNFDCNKGIYGLPFALLGYVMYYNKQVLQQAGLPLSAPKTWSEMANACTKLKAIGKTCIALGFKDFGEWQLAWGPLPNETMTLDQYKGFFTGQTKWTDPEVVAWFQVFQDMVRRGWFNADATAISQTPDAEGMFTSGKSGFIMGFTSGVEDYATMGPVVGQQNLDVGLFPAIEQNNPVPGLGPGPLANQAGISSATAYALSSWSTKRQEAIDWIEWVGTQQNSQAYLDQVGLSARIGLDTSKATPAEKDIINLETPTGTLLVWYIGFKTNNALRDQMAAFFTNSTTPQNAASVVAQAAAAP